MTGDAKASGGVPVRLAGPLGGLSLPRQVLTLALWPFLEQVLNLLVGTVDLALAGHLSPESAAMAGTDALGVASFIGWFMGIVHGALGVGATALVARAVGAGRRGFANAALGQTMLLSLAVGAAVGLTIGTLAEAIGAVAGLEGRALALCRLYLRIVAFAAPFHAVMLAGAAALRGAGDTRTPFAVMVGVNLLNAGTSVLLVYGPDPIGGHGVAGIAGGTLAAWVAGSTAIVAVLIKPRGVLVLKRRRLRPHPHTMARLGRVGLPNLAEVVGGTWLATFVVLTMVGRLPGEGLVGAHMIAVRVESMSFQPGFALGVAAATLAGQYLGAGDPAGARRAVALCWAVGATLMTAVGVAFLLFPAALAGILTNAPPLIEAATTPIRICGAIQLFFATYIVFAQALRGAGDTVKTMQMTYFSVFLIRVPGAWILAHVLGLGLPGIWLALCGDLVVRGGLFAGRFLHGGWTLRRA